MSTIAQVKDGQILESISSPTKEDALCSVIPLVKFCISSNSEKVANWEIYSVLDVGSKGS